MSIIFLENDPKIGSIGAKMTLNNDFSFQESFTSWVSVSVTVWRLGTTYLEETSLAFGTNAHCWESNLLDARSEINK